MGVDFLPAAVRRPRSASRAPKVLVFDSGIGGLTVSREIRRLMPSSEIVYVADDAGFPYGSWPEAALVDHLVALLAALVERHRPDGVVVACNTASTIALTVVREHVPVPVIGTVPAIKPAAERTSTGLVSVLATPGTVAREYTRGLVATHARGVEVTLVGSLRLATLAEARLRGGAVDAGAVESELRPCFVERDGRRTDVVVLACTHYPFLLDLFRRIAPWPVAWIDPGEAIARRTRAVLLGEERFEDLHEVEDPGAGSAYFTSGHAPEPALVRVLARHGLTPAA